MDKKSFDPIWSGHKKDFRIVSKYLIWSGRINYLVFFVCSTLLLKYFIGSRVNDNQMIWIAVLSFLPVITFFYYFSVNRVYWSLLPMNKKTVRIKIILSFWLIFYCLFTIFNLVSYGVSSAVVLKGMWSFGQIISFVGLSLGLVGEIIFKIFDRMIIKTEEENKMLDYKITNKI